jgi:3-methylfumaryl-CoA hydratase
VNTALSEPLLEDTGFEPLSRSEMSAEHARRLAATLDVDPAVLDAGELPPLWHWAFFLPRDATAGLGPDGHGARRPEMAAFPRRMFGAGRVRLHARLRVGEPAARVSEVRSAALKEGSTGTFWVVTVAHEITQRDELCIEEEKDFLLRAPAAVAAPGPDRDGMPDAIWAEPFTPSRALLFRFSAATFNTHRIHYDLPYATEIEEYPDLVVHGPLTALLLAELARRHGAREVRSLAFRAQAPLFVDRRMWLTGGPTVSGVAMTAIRGDHAVAMTLDIELGE